MITSVHSFPIFPMIFVHRLLQFMDMRRQCSMVPIPYEAQEKYLNIILSETDRLTNLTSNLLELNSFNGDNVLLDITTFNICETIVQTVNTLEGTAAKKEISFVLDYNTQKELLVEADESKIHQVLYNLIDNAVKFSHNNSEIKISLRKKGAKVFVSVKDSGIGIPERISKQSI